VLWDGPSPDSKSSPSGSISNPIWHVPGLPPEIAMGQVDDMGVRKGPIAPPALNKMRFTVTDFPPGYRGDMHRTETLDYVLVLSGKIEMELDDEAVYLNQGDVVVMRGTNHRWSNKGNSAARVAFILTGAKPIGLGNPIPGL
jgi:quercetin dioxygenase-like cupin family protein